MFRSAPESVRRTFGYTGPVSAQARSLTEQVGPAWRATFSAGGRVAAQRLGQAMLGARTRGLLADDVTGALVASYTRLRESGASATAERAHEVLAARVERLCRAHDRQNLDALSARLAKASPAWAQRVLLNRLEERAFGVQQAGARRKMRLLRLRVERARRLAVAG